ncbi:MAG: VTT domain-containing protein [Chloroflexi bacterium]|nr:VTT domain-containing protein [Chloroflexota bacterium]
MSARVEEQVQAIPKVIALEQSSSMRVAAPYNEWLKLALVVLGFVCFSFGLIFLFERSVATLHLPIYRFSWLAYLTIFLVFLISNLTVIAPVPVSLSAMMAASLQWNPALIVLFASVGATLGELSGYFAGRLGRKIAFSGALMSCTNRFLCTDQIEKWVHRYGMWAIFLLAVQPVLPFDIAGIVAGTARMPMRMFLPALWAGRVIKYLIIAYAAAGMGSAIPLLFPGL